MLRVAKVELSGLIDEQGARTRRLRLRQEFRNLPRLESAGPFGVVRIEDQRANPSPFEITAKRLCERRFPAKRRPENSRVDHLTFPAFEPDGQKYDRGADGDREIPGAHVSTLSTIGGSGDFSSGLISWVGNAANVLRLRQVCHLARIHAPISRMRVAVFGRVTLFPA